MSRINAEQMGLVPVLWIAVPPGVIPLLQFAFLVYLIWPQACEGSFRFLDEVSVSAKLFCSCHCVLEAFPDNCKVSRGAIEGRAYVSVRCYIVVFRRCSWACNQLAILFNKEIQAELGSTLQHGIIILQSLLVPSKQIMFPKMGRKPGSSHCPVGPLWSSVAQSNRGCHCPNV